jgi:hypothetical protein
MSSLLKIFSGFKTILIVIAFLILCAGGLWLAGAVLITAAEYTYVTFNIFFIAGILLNLWIYTKNRKPMLPPESWKRESKNVFLSALILSVLASINYWQGFIAAPIVAFFAGLFAIYLNYTISEDGKKNLERYATDPNFKYEPILKKTPQWVAGSFIALLLVSGYWYSEIQKNIQMSKDEATQTALSLVDFQTFREAPSIARIKIDAVIQINFKQIRAKEAPGKVLQVCSETDLSFSRDGQYFQGIVFPVTICFDEENTSNWDDYSVSEIVEEQLKKELTSIYGY